jgi:hypothetical protein
MMLVCLNSKQPDGQWPTADGGPKVDIWIDPRSSLQLWRSSDWVMTELKFLKNRPLLNMVPIFIQTICPIFRPFCTPPAPPMPVWPF